MMLRMNNEGSDYGSWEAGSYLHDDDLDDLHDGTDVDDDDNNDDNNDNDDDVEEYENEDAVDAHAHSGGENDNFSIEFDLDVFSSDEAYARALQEAEERDMAARLLALAGINDRKCSSWT